jgi:hypothetical protein
MEEESNVYSPIGGRNVVEHYVSNDQADDELERYRKAIERSDTSRASRRRLYLQLIQKFEEEERKYQKKRPKSKS